MIWTRHDVETVHEFREFLKVNSPGSLQKFEKLDEPQQLWVARQFFRYEDALPEEKEVIRKTLMDVVDYADKIQEVDK